MTLVPWWLQPRLAILVAWIFVSEMARRVRRWRFRC